MGKGGEKKQNKWITSLSCRSEELPFKKKGKNGPQGMVSIRKTLSTQTLLRVLVLQALLIPMDTLTPELGIVSSSPAGAILTLHQVSYCKVSRVTTANSDTSDTS